MSNSHPAPFLQDITLKLLLLALVIGFMVAGKPIFVPLAIALLFAFLLQPVSVKLEAWKFPRWLAILVSLVLAVIVFGGLVFFILLQISSFVNDWPELRESLREKLDSLHYFIGRNFNISMREQEDWLNERMKQTARTGDKLVLDVFSATGNFFANLGLIAVCIFFLLFYREKFKKFLTLIMRTSEQDHALAIIHNVSAVSRKYVKGLLLDVLILSVLNSTGFLLLGIRHAILFGVLAALLNIIPYIGVMIGSSLPVLMALLTKDDIGYAFGAAGVAAFVQFIDNNFIMPYVVGSSVSINPLAAIIALVVSALIWGIPGMILSIPMTGVIKVICDNVDPLKPYGYLIGEHISFRKSRRRPGLL